MNEAFFDQLAAAVCASKQNDDRVTLTLSAEDSDFIRLNRASVRQATSVSQQQATLSIIRGQQRVSSSVSLPADFDLARALLERERATLFEMMPYVPEDPHLLLPDSLNNSSRTEPTDALPESHEVIDELLSATESEDLVGFYASGPMTRAFANSEGQRNWHQVASFHLDWSLFSRQKQAKNRAVKSAYAGATFDAPILQRKMQTAREQLAWLEQPIRQVDPGTYRAWLAPAAVADLLLAMAWSGFSRKERDSGTSSLIRLAEHDNSLSPLVTLTENTQNGIAPAFTETGHLRPAQVSLVTQGRLAQTLTSPRSGAEYGETANAGASEYPEALELAPGSLAEQDALAALGTGLWIGNLWYLNYSDRQAARITGMTRFACFWVEDGEIKAPLGVMRFDDTLLQMFGANLEALGNEAQFLPGSSTWGSRELNSVSSPGALLSGLRLTL